MSKPEIVWEDPEYDGDEGHRIGVSRDPDYPGEVCVYNDCCGCSPTLNRKQAVELCKALMAHFDMEVAIS